jgi:hypothetical protein
MIIYVIAALVVASGLIWSFLYFRAFRSDSRIREDRAAIAAFVTAVCMPGVGFVVGFLLTILTLELSRKEGQRE